MMHPFKHRRISGEIQKILDDLKSSLNNVAGIIPGADMMAYAVDPDDNLSTFWKALLSVKIDINPGWTADYVGSFLRVDLSTIVEWYTSDTDNPISLENGTNWFLKFESFCGIERRVFKRLGAEFEKIEKTFEDELSQNGETIWPVIVHILKARKFIVENHHYELDKLGDGIYRITGVDPNLKGYYTIDFRFRGVLEEAMLKSCLDDPKEGV